ncbi:F-box protein [Rhodotorula paludigena]|uniref:F-box protein n=1 Tax=Rhodotorula paludigena TaxID=86838 RepID=UPI00316FA0CD
MSLRARSTRKSAQGVSYADADPVDESSDESDDADGEFGSKPTKRAKGKGRAPVERGRGRTASDSDDTASSDEDDVDVGPLPARQDKVEEVEYEVQRVDFGKTLPLELLVNIFSYLHPSSLQVCVKLSKTFRSILCSKTLLPVWRAAFEPPAPQFKQPLLQSVPQKPGPLPQLDGADVDLVKLAAALFDTHCQYCDKSVDRGDRYLLIALCVDCRTANLVSQADVGKGKEWQDLHPATLQALVGTIAVQPNDTKWSRSKRWYLRAHIHATSEALESIQIEDDLEANQPLTSSSLEMGDMHKKLSAVRKGKRSWRTYKQKQAREAEAEIMGGWSPGVKAFVLERVEKQKERDKLAEWIRQNDAHLFDEIRAEKMARLGFENRMCVGRRENCKDMSWYTHPLVIKPEPVTDKIWQAISPTLFRILGRIVARNVYIRCGKKKRQLDADSDDEVDLLKRRPKSVSAAGWKYVRPELADVIKEEKVRAVERQKLAAELKAKAPKISPALQNAKDSFFTERYKKIKTMQPSKAAAATLPRLGDFLSLPSVESLYQDIQFGTSSKDAKIEEDIETWGKEHLDDVLDDMQSFAVDTRFEALKLILAATSEDPDAVLEGLDIDALQDYDDDFFLRPSSWLSCGLCTFKFGPLPAVLQHIHDEHPLVSLPFRDVIRPPMLELSLEVACAFSAVLELAGFDGDDSEVTCDELTEKLDDHMLLYKNAPKGVKKRGTWIQLIQRITLEARDEHKQDRVLDVPVLVLKNLTGRERRMRNIYARRGIYW